MKSRSFAPFLVPLFAALTFLYPATSVTGTPLNDSAAARERSTSKPEPPPSELAILEFPKARDLVSEFLFRAQGEQARPSSRPAAAYSIEFMIATVPDPINSRLPQSFDSFIESLESAAETSGYTLDRLAWPWFRKGDEPRDQFPPWHRTLYELSPGLMLFRDPQNQKLLLVFLVGETPTAGIHKDAMFSALEQIAQFYPWDPKHSELPPGFPQVAPGLAAAPDAPPGTGTAGAALNQGDTIRIMGPSFSGSAVSLRFVLDKWAESLGNSSHVRFQIISGTATAVDPAWLAQAAQGHATFQATVPPDSETLHAVACYVNRFSDQKIAILTEDNTAYGQNFTKEEKAAGKVTDRGNRDDCGGEHGPPEVLSLPFPMHISRLRVATSKAPPPGQAGSAPATSSPSPAPTSHPGAPEPYEAVPSFSDVSIQSAELTLSNLLSTISREQYNYVGIVATDVRDAIFLAREVRQHCPATVLFTLNSDLLYAYPDVNGATRGMIVITPYPLFNLEQLWTYAYGGGKSRLQFPNQAAEGVYNATLALLHQDGKLVDYGRPLAVSAGAGAREPHKPSLWVTAIGNEQTLPVALLEWNDKSNYTYSPAAVTKANQSLKTPSVGRGIYAENSVVMMIVLSIFISSISLLLVSQYRQPEKGGTGRAFAPLDDTVSPAYRSECRLFLLCGCMSLLAFYTVLAADFCLPFMTGRELGSGIQTMATPKIAVGIALVTILSLLLAVHTLLSAFRQAPTYQRGSAPEVIIFALVGCGFVFTLAVSLGAAWLETLRVYPASGLFTNLRSFDFAGGLSPLLPLFLVAMGGCFWAVCSFRRLRLLDVLRAAGTAETPNFRLNFLCLEGRSFSGVSELENSVKHILESSSVISLRWYVLLMAVGLAVGHYFFATRLVRALEPRPFYWLFEAAFIIVYWALLMEFLRLVFAWRSLHLLLQRISWHPMLAAFRRYRESRPNLAKMNLTHPPSSFAALEISVNQAGHLVRTARSLASAPDVDEGWREACRKSLPEWEAQVHAAAEQLCEALRLQWTDDSRTGTATPRESVRKKRASRLQGDWRQSLKLRCRSHQALFRLLRSLGKATEDHWSCIHVECAPAPPVPAAKEFFDQVEEFVAGRMVNFLAIVFPSLQNLGYFVLAGLLLMLLAVTSYPFQPRNEFLFFNWIVILSFIGTVFWIFIQMDRDTVLSLLNDTKPGQVNFSRELVLRTLLYVAVPLLALLGAQFPESLRQVLSVLTAGPGGS